MEQKKLLLVVISVGVFLALVIGAGMLVFAPKAKGTPVAPAPLAVQAPAPGQDLGFQPPPGPDKPASVDPSDLVKNQPPAKTGVQGTSNHGDVIIVYGERGAVASGSGTGSGAAAAADANGASAAVKGPDGTTIVNVGPKAQDNPADSAAGQDKSAVKAVPENVAKAPADKPKAKTSATKAPAAKAPAKKADDKAKAAEPKRDADFWIQTGAFSDKARADGAKETLAAKGIASLIETKDVGGKTYFRVMVGPYTSQKEADYWLSLVKTIDGFKDSLVKEIKAKR